MRVKSVNIGSQQYKAHSNIAANIIIINICTVFFIFEIRCSNKYIGMYGPVSPLNLSWPNNDTTLLFFSECS